MQLFPLFLHLIINTFFLRNHRTSIKGANWLLAGLIALLGFTGCGKTGRVEYGTPYADYIVKGVVVNKVTEKPIQGIRVGYYPLVWSDLFGTPPEYYYGPKEYVVTNAKGEFTLKELIYVNNFQWINNSLMLPVYVEDIDGELNGLYQSKSIQVNFSKAIHSGNPKHWYEGVYTITVNVGLTEVEVK
jgi:putative lipoprotein (rSAM/lipoprotein system)